MGGNAPKPNKRQLQPTVHTIMVSIWTSKGEGGKKTTSTTFRIPKYFLALIHTWKGPWIYLKACAYIHVQFCIDTSFFSKLIFSIFDKMQLYTNPATPTEQIWIKLPTPSKTQFYFRTKMLHATDPCHCYSMSLNRLIQKLCFNVFNSSKHG